MEICFWHPDPADPHADRPRRAARPTTRRGISEFPHLYRQPGPRARLLRRVHGERPDADDARLRLRVPRPRDRRRRRAPGHRPPRAHVGRDAGQEKVVRARYVVGADGAHSGVRRSIGCTPQGRQRGPRVGRHGRPRGDRLPGHPPQVRDPVRLRRQHPAHPARGRPPVPHVRGPGRGPAGRPTTRCAARPIEQIVAHANAILHPYTLDVKDVAWHSVYEVGHRVTDRFDDVPLERDRHAHPARLHRGRRLPHPQRQGRPGHERVHAGRLQPRLEARLRPVRAAARRACWPPTPPSVRSSRRTSSTSTSSGRRSWRRSRRSSPTPAELADFYVRTTEFLFGFMTQYPPSMLVAEPAHQALATGFPVGKRFKSAPVVRVADANPLHLGHQHRADGRWRVYAFADARRLRADDVGRVDGRLAGLAGARPRARGGRRRVLDVKVVYQQRHVDVDVSAVPELFLPRTGPFRARRLRERLRRRTRTTTSSSCAASTAPGASSSSGPTSTSRPSCRSTPRTSSRRSSGSTCSARREFRARAGPPPRRRTRRRTRPPGR